VSRRSRAKSALRAASLALVALGLARTALSALGPRYGGELRIAVSEVPATLEPGVPRGLGERVLAGLVHATLLETDDGGLPRPALAQAWSAGADGREWTLRLADATFHDGGPIRSADAVRSLRRFLRSGSVAAGHLARGLDGGEAFRRGGSEDIAGLSAPDETHVVLRFLASGALPLAPLASPAAAVVSGRGAGAGPFVPSTPPSARGLSVTAFGRHVRGRPFLDAVRVVVASADRSRSASELDVSAAAPPLAPASGVLLLVIDPAAPPFSDARARGLVADSVDREQLARHFLPGSEPADVLLAPVLMASAPVARTAAPAGAATLRGPITLRVAADVPPSASQRVVAHLAALGLEVEAIAVPPSLAAAASRQPRLVVWYPEVAEAELALEELAALAGSPPEVRRLLDAADGERDADRRRSLLQRAEEALRATHVVIPLARVPLALGGRPGVHGLRATAAGVLVVEDAWVEP
jgi:MarR-like DNA-binding transcriptional regulator SgrR of sgrS sRNA